MMGGELYLFPNVSDSLLIRSDLVNDESGSGSEPESDDDGDGSKTLATPSRPSTCLRALSSFGMSQLASTILTSSWFQDDDWREDSDCQSIPDGIVAPQLDAGLLCSSRFQSSDDEYEFSASDNESFDEKSAVILDACTEALSSGHLNFGLSLEVNDDDSNDDTDILSLCAPRQSTAAHMSDDSKSDRSKAVPMAKEKEKVDEIKERIGDDELVWCFADSGTEVRSLFSFDNKLLSADTAPGEDMDQLALSELVPAAVESKRRGITRPLCHCRAKHKSSKEETVTRVLETVTPSSVAAIAILGVSDELLKRQWNADGTRRFDFSMFVEMSKESEKHIARLLQKAHLI